MMILKYLLGVVLFFGVFQVGKWMIALSRRWESAPDLAIASHTRVSKFFLWSGRLVQVVAVIWGFLDAVSVLVLGLAF